MKNVTNKLDLYIQCRQVLGTLCGLWDVKVDNPEVAFVGKRDSVKDKQKVEMMKDLSYCSAQAPQQETLGVPRSVNC